MIDEQVADYDPFDDMMAFTQDDADTQTDVIDSSLVDVNKSASTSDNDDDFSTLMESDKAKIQDVTEESVTSHVEERQEMTADTNTATTKDDAAKQSTVTNTKNDNSSIVDSIALPATPQAFADHLAVTFEAQIKADKVSVVGSSPRRWQYNYRIQFESTVIHLCQVEFKDNETIVRMRFSYPMLTNKTSDGGSMRLAVLQLLIQSLKLGRLGFLKDDSGMNDDQLILLPETVNPFTRIFSPQLEFTVARNGQVGIKVTDYE